MSDWLSQAGYSLGPASAIWQRNEFNGIPYSDGDEFEGRIEKILLEAKDKSLLSGELAAACVDWPSYYHLSSVRANILRPFDDRLRGADVLEVGAGCGAITRFLAESGANVCALEGSPRRARIARLRTSDLPQVTVVAENFEAFAVSKKFDVVTFIGVLEYAHQFIHGEKPACAMLEKARAMLKPGGVVYIAIENQLGLKYFAGAPEDHVPRRMFGLEDRYSPGGVRTYGRQELDGVVREAGFSSVNFFAPFPDYKFPVTIFTEAGMVASDFDATSMLGASIFTDRQLTEYLSFDLPRVWDVVMRNKLGMELANSFLVAASAEPVPESSALAWHFSSSRAPQFCKALCLHRSPDGDIRIAAQLLNGARENPVGDKIKINVAKDIPYVRGTPLSNELRSLLAREGWRIEEVAQFVKRYLSIAEDLMRREGYAVTLSSAEQLIPGQFVDLIPQNIIRDDSGAFSLIDREWRYEAPVSVEWLVFRAFAGFFSSLPLFAASGSDCNQTRLGFLVALYRALGFGGGEAQIGALGSQEAHLQSLVQGKDVAGDSWGPTLPVMRKAGEATLPLHSFQEIVESYADLRRLQTWIVSEQQRLETEAAAVRSRIGALEAERDEYRDTLCKIERSVWWRMLRPLRYLRAVVEGRGGSIR